MVIVVTFVVTLVVTFVVAPVMWHAGAGVADAQNLEGGSAGSIQQAATCVTDLLWFVVTCYLHVLCLTGMCAWAGKRVASLLGVLVWPPSS